MTTIPQHLEAAENLEGPYDASDPAQVKGMRKKASKTRRARLEFVEGMMTLPQGRRWLSGLMERCFVFGNPLVAGDTHNTYFNLGMQNIGKMILADVTEFPDLYSQMMKEAKENK